MEEEVAVVKAKTDKSNTPDKSNSVLNDIGAGLRRTQSPSLFDYFAHLRFKRALKDYIVEGFNRNSNDELIQSYRLLNTYFTVTEIKDILNFRIDLQGAVRKSHPYPKVANAIDSYNFDLAARCFKYKIPIQLDIVVPLAKSMMDYDDGKQKQDLRVWQRRQVERILKSALEVIKERLWDIVTSQTDLVVIADKALNQRFIELFSLFRYFSEAERDAVLNSKQVLPVGISMKSCSMTLFSSIKGIYNDRENIESLRDQAAEQGAENAVAPLLRV